MHHAGHLTTHSTELSFVGGWHGNIGTVVTIKAHYQAEGCFQHNKFATIEDFNSIDRFDRWGHNFAIYLKTDKKLLVGKGSKDEKHTSFTYSDAMKKNYLLQDKPGLCGLCQEQQRLLSRLPGQPLHRKPSYYFLGAHSGWPQ